MRLEGLDVTMAELEVEELVAFKHERTWTVRLFSRAVLYEAKGETLGKALEDIVSRIMAGRT